MPSFDLISNKMPFGGRQKPIVSLKIIRCTWKTTSRCFFYLLQLFLAFSNTT